MSEIDQFLQSKHKRDFPWGLDLYKRCGGQEVIIKKLEKEGFSKANWEILRYELKKFRNKNIKIQKAKTIQKSSPKPKEVIKKTQNKAKIPKIKDKPGNNIGIIEKKNEPKTGFIMNIANYFPALGLWMKDLKWPKLIKGSLKSGIKSMNAGK